MWTWKPTCLKKKHITDYQHCGSSLGVACSQDHVHRTMSWILYVKIRKHRIQIAEARQNFHQLDQEHSCDASKGFVKRLKCSPQNDSVSSPAWNLSGLLT